MRRAAVLLPLFVAAGCSLSVDGYTVDGSEAGVDPQSIDAPPSSSSSSKPDPCGDKTSCGGKCVDTKSDPRNCGDCGNDCGDAKCKAGKCAPSGD